MLYIYNNHLLEYEAEAHQPCLHQNIRDDNEIITNQQHLSQYVSHSHVLRCINDGNVSVERLL